MSAESSSSAAIQNAGSSSLLNSWSWIQANVNPLSNIVDTVKKQTEVVATVYKRDLSEFVDVVTAQSKERIGEWSHQITTLGILSPPNNRTDVRGQEVTSNGEADESDDEDDSGDIFSMFTNSIGSLLSGAVQITPAEDKGKRTTTIFDRKSATIAEIRKTPKTYLQDPEPSTPASERFKTFRQRFVVSRHASAIAKILADDNIVAQLMGRIVPSQASYEEFWARYFFRIQEVDYEEEQRKKIVENASLDEEEITWDSDEDNQAGQDAPHHTTEPSISSNIPPPEFLTTIEETDRSELPSNTTSSTPSNTIKQEEAITKVTSSPPTQLSQTSPVTHPILDSIKDHSRDSSTSSHTEDWTNVDAESSVRGSAELLNRDEVAASLHGDHADTSSSEDREKEKAPQSSLSGEAVVTATSSKEEEDQDWADWE